MVLNGHNQSIQRWRHEPHAAYRWRIYRHAVRKPATTQWSTSGNDKETFSLYRRNHAGFDDNRRQPTASVSFTGTSALANQTETDITVTSLFLQDQIAVTEKLQVLLGARVDNVEISITDIKNNNTTITGDDTQTSPRLGLIYKRKQSVAYANAGELRRGRVSNIRNSATL